MTDVPKYTIYRQWHMEGYTEVEAESRTAALLKVEQEDSGEPHDNEWQIDGWGDCANGPDYSIYAIDGKRVTS